MFRLFFLLLALPWPVMALIAAGLFWVAQDSHRSALENEAEKAQALLEPVPAPVALDQFTDADVHLADEVHVTAWINTDHNYELTKQRKGTDTVRRMFVLFGPGDAADSKVARGIVMLPPDEVDAFVMHLMTNVADPMDPRLPFHLNGAVDQTPELSDMMRDAFEERGLTKAEDFVVLTPFLQGREAALAPDPDAPMRVATVFGVLGGVAALLALGKLMRGKRRPKVPQAPVVTDLDRARMLEAAARPVTVAAQAGPTGLGYATVPTPQSGAWSPLEAVRARQAAREATGAAAMHSGGFGPSSGVATGGLSGMGVERSLPVRDEAGAGLRRLYRMPAGIVGALALYVAMYLSFGHFTGPSTMNTIPEGGMVAEVMEGLIGFDPAEFEVEFEQGATVFTDETAQVAPVLPVQVGSAAGVNVAEAARPTVPVPQGISGVDRPLPQIGDKPPAPKDQVREDIAAGMPPAEAIRKAITAEFPDETGPKGPVFLSTAEEEPGTEAGLMQRLRDLVPQGWDGMDPAAVSAPVTGGGLWKGPVGIAVLLALGSVLATIGLAFARRSRQRAVAAQTDPWSRISERLQ
jgi:hypothetical protein